MQQISGNVLCDDKKQMESILIQLGELLKDSDNVEAKNKVKEFTTTIAQDYRILAVGDNKTGRTTALTRLFTARKFGEINQTVGIEEIRYGAQEVVIQLGINHTRRFLTDTELSGLVLIDVGNPSLYQNEIIRNFYKNTDIILAILSSENIQNLSVWEYIKENVEGKKVVCLLTKSDLYPKEIIDKKIKKIKEYMHEIDIDAPVFAVSNLVESSNQWDEVNYYIKMNIVGKNPVMQKQAENVYMVNQLIQDVKASFIMRQQQLDRDINIMQQIDKQMNELRNQHINQVEEMKKDITGVIGEEVSRYRDSIIKQLNPKTLRQNPVTRDRNTFREWLQHEVDKYEHILNQKVQDKTHQFIKHYLEDLDNVYMEATECLNNRETILSKDDKFYGSMAAGKSNIVKQTKQISNESHESYMTLIEASEELFKKMMKEREKYELKKYVTESVSTIGGFVGGTIAAHAAITTAAAAATTAATTATATTALTTAVTTAVTTATTAAASVAIPILIGLVGAALLFEGAKIFSEKMYGSNMEKNANKYIEEFKCQVEGIKSQMTEKVIDRMMEIFDKELNVMDKSFLSYRTTTNIDVKNVPLLEMKLQNIDSMFHDFIENEGVYTDGITK